MTRSVDARCDQHVEEVAALDPLAATYTGIRGHDHELPDLSPDGMDAVAALDRRALADVAALDPVDHREAVAKAAFLERVGLDIEIEDAGLARSQVSVISSPLHAIRAAFDLMPKEGEEAWHDIRARLALIPETLAGYRATLRAEAAAGHVVAARQYAEVATQIRNWTGQEGHAGSFFAGLAAEGPDGMRGELETAAASASEAYAEFGRFLVEEMAPQGRANEAVGRDAYALWSRRYLGARIDLDSTYAWGWQELERITDDMAAMADAILPGAGVPEAVEHLDADPTTYLTSKDAFRDWMQQLASSVIDDLHGTHFDIPEQIRRIECRIAPTNDGGVYYTGPSEDFSRPGRMWWSVPDEKETFSYWREMTTVYHEGVPGHHLQVGTATVRAELLNRWQRLFCWVSGHGEGWALYAERLMDELGRFPTPADRLGMLDGQAFRAARVIIDIGMHLELEIPRDNPFGFHPGERWTPALGREFMGLHSLDAPSVIDFEVKRYLGWPGQAPAYKVGERIWLEAREEARARKGAAFDPRAFHTAALNLGSLGLDPFREAVAEL